MTELIQSASDDQLALSMCFAAVAFSGLIMYFSHYVGKFSGRIGVNDRRTLPIPVQPTQSISMKSAVETRVHEKAA